MRITNKSPALPLMTRWMGTVLVVAGLLAAPSAGALGSWTNVIQMPTNSSGQVVGVQQMLLLSDGTVMAQQISYVNNYTSNWFRLTPDLKGSYVNGSWTTLAPMRDTRQFFSSAVLQDGRVFVAGGEYGTGSNRAEIYDPRNDAWSPAPIPPALLNPANDDFVDSDCVILPNGKLLVAPVQNFTTPNGTWIFNASSNSWSAGPLVSVNQDEATWIKLPDDSILTIDPNCCYPNFNPNDLNTSERFIPSLNNGQGGWIPDAPLPVPMFNAASETGPGLLLPDGRAVFIGGLGHLVYYTPTGNTNPGSWTLGPDLISPGVGWDDAAAMMINGRVLIEAAGKSPPTNHISYFEFDPLDHYPVGTITLTPDWQDVSGAAHMMLDLPDGTVLVSNGTGKVHIYRPDPVPLPSGKPTIISITPNSNGSFHLTGTRLNGNSQGSSFGDDAQMDSNYPLVRLTDAQGNVYYAPTLYWSSTGVMTGNKLVSTEFTLPPAVYRGTYSLVVVANGISSDPVSFAGPVWVDFKVAPLQYQIGSYFFPFQTMRQATNAVASHGSIFIKGPGASPENIILSTPMTITAIGGPATIGK